MTAGAWLCLFAPLAGAVLITLAGTSISRRAAAWVSTASVFIAFAGAVWSFLGLRSHGSEHGVVSTAWTWLESGNFKVGLSVLVDPLSTMMMLIVTGVGGLIVLYSIGYMDGDEEERRYFAYMSLFVFSMLMLVQGGNLLLLLVGWGLVGLSSYLLIGFWHEKPSAVAAAKKAFVMNAVGDATMALAFFVLIAHSRSLEFATSFATAGHLSSTTVNLVALGLLGGAAAKSAQIPLHTWLPDAMEGPTPVSALIHAATMVTAGVYLIVRSNFIFDYAPHARTVVVIVATVTLLYGAIIGCAKDDIKKALAGSTMSQIGYMMLGAGLGIAGYPFAIFHLLTHGFFKANMFLGAGSVMHGMDDDVDMRHYGALRKAMPVTFLTFAMGYLAIIGFPGFSGFWSKDRIIEEALTQNWLVGVLAMVGAGVTGFYMSRLMFLTFFTSRRWADDVHPHESPKVMTIPLMVLAALSVLGGLMLAGNWIVNFLEPVTGTVKHENPPLSSLLISAIVVVIVAVGVALAWYLVERRDVPREAPQGVSFPVRAARAELYGNQINDELVIRPGGRLVGGLTTMDRHGVDGVVEGGAAAIGGLGSVLRRAQNGFVRSYALSVLIGALLVVAALLAVNAA
jgi:NADH-quinone oxidoreductase subunit L